MDHRLTQIATECLSGAERNTMTFPQIVGTLSQAGFESYAVDFRRASATYYRPDGDSVVLPTHLGDAPGIWCRSPGDGQCTMHARPRRMSSSSRGR
jgi:hypothetical protein